MTPYALLLVFHVLIAILGVGQVASLGVLAGAAQVPSTSKESVRVLTPLVRVAPWSLLLMLLSGVLLDVLAEGAFHQKWWFRLSGLLLFVVGFLSAQARRSLRKMENDTLDPSSAQRRLAILVWSMIAIVGLISVLMVEKPW